jgi:hypothetical protein
MNFRRRFFFVVVLMVLNAPAAFSQVDSLSKRIYFKNLFLFNDYELNDSAYTDQSLETVHLYDALQKNFIFIERTGNAGSAHNDFYGNFQNVKLFNNGFNQYDYYLLKPYEVKTAIANNRFTNINYHLGSKKEQHIFIKHQQALKPWLLAGLDFGALASPGDFARQLTGVRNFDIYTAIEIPSGIYRGYFNFTSNRVLNQENGGITDDTLFENASALDTRTLPVNLTSASNRIKSRDYFVKHELNLSDLFHNAKKDSSRTINYFGEKGLVLAHTFWLERKSNLFRNIENNNGYFKTTYFDTLNTYDSTFYSDLYNQLTLEYNFKLISPGSYVKIGAGAENQSIDYVTAGNDTTFNFSAAVAYVRFMKKQFFVNAFLKKNLEGNFARAYNAKISAGVPIRGEKDLFSISVENAALPPNAKELFYVSNHFIWLNDFPLIKQTKFSGSFWWKKLNLTFKADADIFKNYIFYHSDMLPQRYNKSISVLSFILAHDLRLNKFGLRNNLQLQKSGNENVIPLPEFSAFSGIYYENDFFKNALKLRSGFDIRYHTKYYANSYMPATGIFFLQQEKKTGTYPYVDFYVNLKIKTVRLFVKLENLAAGLTDRTYYGAYHYPLPGRAFKFGINWDLTD